jgi:F0F1-type ATP synthase membrane subunit c/vacuolar-type H+-ATPase subunit K
MTMDPWAALEARRQRRHWRAWPWGWAALVLGVAAWGCAFMLTILVMASVGMPGDGSHAMQATQPYLLFTLALSAAVVLAALVSIVLSFRLRRQRAGGGVGLALLALLAAVLLVPALLERTASTQVLIGDVTPIWQAGGGQG